MKTLKFVASFLLLSAASVVPADAEIKMCPLFTDNMVMQQKADAPVWGTADARSTVTVTTSWNNAKYTATADENTLIVQPCRFTGGIVDAVNDHRIAMAAAIAATNATAPVTILGAQCVAKSYPTFWDEFTRLGGKI